MLADFSDKSHCTSSYTSASVSSLSSLDYIPNDSHSEFDDITTIKVLHEAKFAVYLAISPHSNQYYALKVFPWKKGQPSNYFLREVRFSKFRHPNIVSIPHLVHEHEAYYDDAPAKVSYLLMEYAKYGDFFNVLVHCKVQFSETLVRTYFHQLIDGLEFLHANGAAHLDIKLENLLLGEHYTLKITDFDLSYLNEDGAVKTKGTKNFRAPELLARTCKNPQSSDIYSAGIMLFLFKTMGNLPYLEVQPSKGVDMAELKIKDPNQFWEKHCQLSGRDPSYFSESFKDLFLSMTKFNPEERPTIPDIKASVWYNGTIYSRKELAEYMRHQFSF
jgi:serine/threonine protein kinase